MTRALVAFGSNIDPDRNVVEALRRLAGRVTIVAVSPVYETPPAGTTGPPFLNGAVEIETDLDAEALRTGVLRTVEEEMGRRRTADPNAPRPIDLDLVFHGDRMREDPAGHAHVLVPLADLAPDRIHPPTGAPLRELAARRSTEAAAFRKRTDLRIPPRP